MKQKIANQSIKKNFILYKGHTGWKIKTRIFGTLLVGLSAMTIAESAGTVDAHAATEAAPSADTSPEPAPKTTGTATLKNSTGETPASKESGSQAPASSQESSSQAPASKESSSQAPASQVSGSQAPASSQESSSQALASQVSGSQASANKESVSQALTSQAPATRKLATRALSLSRSVTPASMSIAPESLSLNDVATDTTNDATSNGQYQTLTPDQSMTVGKTDGSGVTLSGSQVQDHFTNKVVNLSNNKKIDMNDPATAAKVSAVNTSIVAADSDGVWQLTKPGIHYYNDPDNLAGGPVKITDGPQVAHVAFENEIDFGHDFSMTGALGIGTSSNGADGVGIVFAPGDPEYATTGKSGGNLGLGGLNNAFAFVYDQFHNSGDDTSGVTDPGSGAYFGWRSTNANGTIQNVTDPTTWKAASSFDLSNRATNPLIDFTMNYDSLNKVLTVIIQNQKFTRNLTGIDTSKGYSISIAASTGQDKNDYSARIDSFTYTPKTASVNVKVATAAGDVSTTTPVTANIGDTISVFSTKAAAERAVAADPTLDPKLVTVIPASTTNNVYLVDGDQVATSKGTVHYIDDDSSIADGAYYSYTVTDDATQALTVPISQAFTAEVTPIDSVTGVAIPGMDPIQVNTVSGKSVVIQVPGYTPVTVKLDAPAAGETVAQDKVKINTGTTPSTDTDVANPIEHYYTATGETIDGTPVTANVTVGTNQSVTDALNATPIGEDGKPVTAGTTPAYTWSTVPNASATDSTDSTTPQDSKSILVPTKATLDKWLQKAKDNQTQADASKQQAQDIYDKFVGLAGITQDQKDAAKKLLDSVNDMYDQISTNNVTAKADLQAAEDSTDPETIFENGQAGYGALANVDDTMTTFQNDLNSLTSTNDAAVKALATFVSWSKDYGKPVGYPDVTVGADFGTTLTADQKAGFGNPDYFYFVDAADSDTHVTPKDAGTYYYKLTDAGRTYLKSLTTNTNAGLYTSAALTINPVDVTPTLTDSSLQYGGVAGILPLAYINYHLGTVSGDDDPALKITQDDFEIDDANGNKVEINKLQVGGKYTIRYTDDAQATLKADKNYNFTFGTASTATLTVTPREVSIAAANVGKTYGDADPAALSLDNDSAKAALVNGDDVSSLGAALTRETGENVGSYKISGTATANQNYAVKVTDGTFTIAKKPITVTANNVNVDYDGTAHQVDQAGFKLDSGDDNKLVGTDTLTDLKVTLTPSAETNAGTYTISGSSTAANYDVTVNDGTLTIAQKAATITADAATVGYGDALPTFTVTNSDTGLKTTLDNTDFEIFDNNAKAVATGQLQAGGDYAIRLTQAAQESLKTANPNYKLSFGTDVLTVNKKPITVQINNVDATYDGTAHSANGFSIAKDNKLVDGDSDDALGVTLDPISETDAGTYTITGKANSANYAVTVNDGTLTIAQKDATITADAATVGYGDALPTLTVTNSDTGLKTTLDNTDFEIFDNKANAVATGQLQAGGDYAIRLTQAAQDSLKTANPNYKLSFGANKLTVSQRAITVQINNVDATYDGAAHGANGFSISKGDKLVDGDSDDALGVTLDPISETDAGTYTITGKTDSANYAVTVEDGTLTIAQKAATITADAATVGYGDALPTLTVTNSDTGLKTTLDNTDFEIFDNKANAVATGQLQAGGDYTIRLTQAAQESLNTDNPNYKLSFGANKLTVSQRAITVHIENGGKDYGVANDPALTFTIPATTAAGQTNGTLVDPDTQDALGVTLTRETGNDAGSYNITGTASNDGNYKVSIENDGTFTIAPIAGTATVADTSVVYGDALSDDKVTVNGTDTSELSADNFEIVDTKTKSVVTADKLQVNGSYTVQLTQKAQDALSKANPNYTLSFVAGGLAVTKRPITVQMNNVTTTYDGKAHGANGFIVASGDKLVDGDSDDALGVTLDPISETNAGTYTITGKAASANYDVTLKDGALNITQADGNVVVTGTSVVYGDSLPSLSVSVNGAAATKLSADNFEIVDTKTKSVVTADKLQVNGSYTVQLTQKAQDTLSDANPNYKLSFGTDAILTVTKRPITVQVNNVTTTYDGKAHGANGFVVATDVPNNALVDGDSNDALSVTLNPISETNVGSYTISGNNDSANYDVTLKDGALNITQADGNVAVKGTSVVYGDSLPSLSVSVNGAAASELSADNFEIVDTKTNAVVTADKLQVNGTYTVQLTKDAQDTLSTANSNYKLTFGTDTLTVTKRPITVQINNVETTYDGTAHGANGFSIAKDDKLVDGDNDDALSVTLNPISETNVGSYTISGKNASANYDVTLKDGTLKIDQKAGNVAVTGTSVVYGNSLPSLSVSVNGAAASEMSADNFEIVDTKTKSVVTASQLQAGGSYTVQLTQKAQGTLNDANGNYKLSFGTDAALTVTKRPVTVQVSDQQSYAGDANPQNDAQLTSGAFKDGEGVTDLNLTYSEPTNPAVGSYTIDAINGNTNYDVKVLSGQLTVLGKEKDAAGTTTITEKDAAGNVVKIDKQWPDGSHTTYTYDPATDKRTVSEQKDGKQVDEQELTSDSSKVTLSDDTNTSTTVTLDPTTKQPVFEHDTTQTAGDTTTTKDADGNVVKVVKQWPDGNQTTYTYDPITGDRAVTEQKDGKPVDQQKITSDDAKTTLSSGDDVKTIVNTGKPGSQPTFEHDTTKTTTDDAGNVTATTKDDAGNVIDVTKQWTDGSTTKYTYDPATGKQNVTEQKDGKTVDQKTITPDAPKATLSTGNGVETTVNAPKPGAEPTFDHETTKTDGDTTTTTDADGNVVKVVKQWPDDSQTTYTYDPTTGNRTVTEQKDGKTDEQPIAKDTNKATVSAVDGAKTIVNAGQPGSQPTFEHDTTQTTKDDAGNVTATTKDDAGNVIDVTKQWTDGSTTKYTYDPATGKQNVTEQKDGQTVDQKTITPDAPKATLSTGNGVETIVNAPKPGAEPTFDHETTQTTGDTTTTKDADGNVIKVVKQWPDGSQTTYTYDPTTGNRTVTEQKDGKTVDQKTFGTDPAKETLASGDGVKTIVNAGKPGSQPTFEHDTTQTATDDAGNVTATTKDDAGNVIDVTKQWTDGSQTTYTYDPATKTQTVTEQKDGKTVDQKTITPDAPKATLSTGNGVETTVNAPKPGAEPTFDHETTHTVTDKSGNTTATTKDTDGNVVKVVKQWTDGSQTTYTFDPTTGKQTVTEQKDGKTVDQKTITPDKPKATLASGDGAETLVTAGQPGAEPTFEHDTTKTTTDKSGNVTTTTKDADGNVIEVTKQWTDGSKTIYTSDPKTGKQTVTEQKDGKTVDQKTITPDTKATLSSGNGVETVVNAGQPGSQPTFEHKTTQTTTDKSGNVTTTTKDADGNVINVTKQWTDGSKTIYTSDPKTGKQTVTEQKDGKTVDEKTITPNAKATLASGDGVETIVTAGKLGTEPTFEHDATKTTTDKSGNVTTTTKDADGNVIKVTEQWTDGSVTTYTYDPATGNRVVTEQRDGKVVDQQTIDPNATKATLSSGAGVETIVNAGQPGAQPTFEHETIKTTTDKSGNVTATTTDANGNVVKVTKQWTDGSKTIYTYDPATGKRTVTEQRDGKVVDQQAIDPNASQVTLVDGAGGKVIVNFGKAGAEPSFTRQLAAQTDRRQVTVKKADDNQGKRASKQAKPAAQGKKSAQSATTNEVAGDVAVTGRVQAQPKAKSNQKQTELPQTGQKNESLLAEVGVVLLALLAVPFIRRRSH